jgi:hypothetical protein
MAVAQTEPSAFWSRIDPFAGAPYNYAHFLRSHLLAEAAGTLQGRGVQPGTVAPDFELPTAGGDLWRLSDHHGTPVVLRFGSYT